LRQELQSRDAEIAELRSQLNGLLGADQESQRLRTELLTVTAYYEDRLRKVEEQISSNDLKARIVHGETARLEFKSSLRWNVRANRDDEGMEQAVLKTVAAFCNTEGGELLIGVADDGTLVGIEHDHFPNDDRFLLHVRNLITDRLVPSVVGYVEYDIVELDDKRICHIVCKQSPMDVWVKADKTEAFYVRSGPSSTQLAPRDAVHYIQEHFRRAPQ
jgi:predicted HTH transcriptional regulator